MAILVIFLLLFFVHKFNGESLTIIKGELTIMKSLDKYKSIKFDPKCGNDFTEPEDVIQCVDVNSDQYTICNILPDIPSVLVLENCWKRPNFNGKTKIRIYGPWKFPDNHLFAALIVLFAIFGILALLGVADATWFKVNDTFTISNILIPGIFLFDQISDAIFADYVYRTWRNNQNTGLLDDKGQPWIGNAQLSIFLLQILLILLPQVYTIIKLNKEISSDWLTDNFCGRQLSTWLLKHDKKLYLLSIITGSSYAAVKILNSGLFGMDLFNMGLPPKLKSSFANGRIVAIVFCENIPQLILNTIFMITQSQLGLDGVNFTSIASLVMSFLSITSSILSYCTSRKILENDEIIIIQMDVLSKEVEERYNELSRTTKKFRKEIGKIIRQDYTTVWMYKPLPIVTKSGKTGVHLVFSVNAETYISGKKNMNKLVNEYAELIREFNKNGTLPTMIQQKAWNLQSMPKVLKIKLNHDPSSKSIRSEVTISTGNDGVINKKNTGNNILNRFRKSTTIDYNIAMKELHDGGSLRMVQPQNNINRRESNEFQNNYNDNNVPDVVKETQEMAHAYAMNYGYNNNDDNNNHSNNNNKSNALYDSNNLIEQFQKLYPEPKVKKKTPNPDDISDSNGEDGDSNYTGTTTGLNDNDNYTPNPNRKQKKKLNDDDESKILAIQMMEQFRHIQNDF